MSAKKSVVETPVESAVAAAPFFPLSSQEKTKLVMVFRTEAQKKSLVEFRKQVLEWVGEEIYKQRDFDKVDFKFNSDKLAFAQKAVSALGDNGAWAAALQNEIVSDKPEEEKLVEHPVAKADSVEVITSNTTKDDQIPQTDSKKTEPEAATPAATTEPAKAPAKKAKEGKVIKPDTSLTVDRPLADVKKDANRLVKSLGAVKNADASSTILDLIALTATTADHKGREDATTALNLILDHYRVINFKMYKALLTFIRDFTHLRLKEEKIVDEYSRRKRMVIVGQKDELERTFKGFYTNGTLYKEQNGENVYKGVFFTASGAQGKGDLFLFTDHYEDVVKDEEAPEIKQQKAIANIKRSAISFVSLVNDEAKAGAVLDALAEDKATNIAALESLLEDLKKR